MQKQRTIMKGTNLTMGKFKNEFITNNQLDYANKKGQPASLGNDKIKDIKSAHFRFGRNQNMWETQYHNDYKDRSASFIL